MDIEKINVGGNEYDVCDAAARAMNSDEFSTTATYAAGDYCIYNNTLYRFTADKAAGAWDSSKVAATQIGDELSQLNSNVSALLSPVVRCQITGVSVSAGTLKFTIGGFESNNSAMGLYVLSGTSNNQNFFTVAFVWAYSATMLGQANANMYTNFEFSMSGTHEVTLKADQITEGMNFDVQCIKIAPLRNQ